MTDTTHEAPERIWAWGWRVGSGWQEQTWQHEDEPRSTMEYVRADLVQAAVAAALREAAENVEDWGRLLSGTEDVSEEVIGDILALIPEGAQAALDRVAAAERERGFWLGRSCSGSKAEIDAALAAIRKGGE